MTDEHLRYAAARLALENFDAFDIQQEIDTLMNEGVYHDDFLEIMDSKPPRMAEVLAPFVRTLKRLGVEVPSKEDAVWQLVRRHTNRIASGKVGPMEGLTRLIADVYWDYDFQASTQRYLGDSHGAERLFGLYWSCDDLAEVEHEIFEEAKRWQDRFSAHP